MNADRTRRAEIIMKKTTIPLLGLIALLGPAPGLRGVAAAQTVVSRIAYDQCWADAINWVTNCYVGMVVDGQDVLFGDGLTPKWSPDGTKIAFTGTRDNDINDVLVFNLADGSITNVTNNPAFDSVVMWSRDGRIIFGSDRSGTPELYVMEANGANVTRFTGEPEPAAIPPGSSPDGRRVAFTSSQDGTPELYVMDADGSNLTRLTTNVGFNGGFVWSPDSSRLALECALDGVGDICAVNVDGTNFARLTNDPGRDSGPIFSPRGDAIAFRTEQFGPPSEIAVVNADGVVTRVAPAGLIGLEPLPPVWTPDGSGLMFFGTTPSFYSGRCYLDEGAHNADDFCMAMYDIYIVKPDGTGLGTTVTGTNADAVMPLPGQPVATFTSNCNGTVCDFDAAGSFDFDGTIASYAWQFGDGTSSTGPSVHHEYAIGNYYSIGLAVTDNSGATGVVRRYVVANIPPVASLSVVCDGPTCTFDGSASTDSDGTITRYTWYFGDGQIGSGAIVSHTYRMGTFSATLYVNDDSGAAGTAVTTLSVVNRPPVASFTFACDGLTCNFDGSGSSDPDGTIFQYSWWFGDGTYTWGVTASRMYAAGGSYTVELRVTGNSETPVSESQTVTVGPVNSLPVASFTAACSGRTCSFSSHGLLAHALVSGAWNDGSISSCTTNANGQCAVSRSGILKKTNSVSFTVTNVSRATFVYEPAANHDPDGDSNGTTVSVSRP
jgi:Tol biopolymer transport system component